MAIDFLYTEIGRGHPFYLDGIRQCLPDPTPVQANTVFSCSRGISLLGWRMARAAYQLGSSALGGGLYSRLRGAQTRAQNGMLVKLLVRDVQSAYSIGDTPLVVAHPLLVKALSERTSLFYQHGEVVAPSESLQTGRHTVFVPTPDLADRFMNAGVASAQIIVTGLCIEDALTTQSQDDFTARMSRYASGGPLTLALYSSGAEPLAHVRQLRSCARALLRRGHRVIAFCRQNGRLQTHLESLHQEKGHARESLLTLEPYRDRAMLHERTMAQFSTFDAFLAPSHERTQWALGLGLPMFMTGPAIGTFAPLNRDVLLAAGVARDLPADIDEAWVNAALHRNDSLTDMSLKGWEQHPISGFQTIANVLQT